MNLDDNLSDVIITSLIGVIDAKYHQLALQLRSAIMQGFWLSHLMFDVYLGETSVKMR